MVLKEDAVKVEDEEVDVAEREEVYRSLESNGSEPVVVEEGWALKESDVDWGIC